MDCNPPPAQYGCLGGDPSVLITYAQSAGLSSAADYPYAGGAAGACRNPLPDRQSDLAVNGLRYSKMTETQLLEALQKGPVAIGVVLTDEWFDYTGGVFAALGSCGASASRFNHFVLVVGAGVDKQTGMEYWILRNSFGPDWGEGGYMRYYRGIPPIGYCTLGPISGALSLSIADVVNSASRPNCSAEPVPLLDSTRLVDLAAQYNTSISAIQLENKLTIDTPANAGVQLNVKCPAGIWSRPFAAGANGTVNAYNDRSERPYQGICQAGDFVSSIQIGLTGWSNAKRKELLQPYVYSIEMECTPASGELGGLTYNAQQVAIKSESSASMMMQGRGRRRFAAPSHASQHLSLTINPPTPPLNPPQTPPPSPQRASARAWPPSPSLPATATSTPSRASATPA
jgi:hypothetical protein